MTMLGNSNFIDAIGNSTVKSPVPKQDHRSLFQNAYDNQTSFGILLISSWQQAL